MLSYFLLAYIFWRLYTMSEDANFSVDGESKGRNLLKWFSSSEEKNDTNNKDKPHSEDGKGKKMDRFINIL